MTTDRVLQYPVVVQKRRSTNELQRSQAAVAQDVKQGDVAHERVVQPDADLDDDDADLPHRGERQRGFNIGLHAAGKRGEQCRHAAERNDDHPQPRRQFQQRTEPQQQERPEMDRQRAVKHGARRRRPFHRAGQPAGKRHQRRLPRRRRDQQQADAKRMPRCNLASPLRPRSIPEEQAEIAVPFQVMQHDRGDEQCGIGNAIDDPHAQTIAARRGAIVIEGDQQRR